MEDRRSTLKILGAIGTTCVFPFASDELYGQHVHPAAGAQVGNGAPAFFTQQEFAIVSRIADLIIPTTDTPGAVEAGVPLYIDYVVAANEEWKKLFREGCAALAKDGFAARSEAEQIAVLERYIDQPGDGLMIRFFRAMKGMTADGYYTSKVGLVDELGYRGNTVRPSYPSCEVPEH